MLDSGRVKGVRISLIYCCPQLNAQIYRPLARRFVDSYMSNPPGATDHELYVGLNGADKVEWYHEQLFLPLRPQFLLHNNWGKDVGLFQRAADVLDCDLLICFGSHIHFNRAGWLDRMVQAYLENGPTVYGAQAYHHPRPHIRTTALWLPPELLRLYPNAIGDRDRYGFEHGPDSITLWSQQKGFEPLMVTWNEVLPMAQWRHVSRDEALFIDQHLDRQ